MSAAHLPERLAEHDSKIFKWRNLTSGIPNLKGASPTVNRSDCDARPAT
jgi:hypothetical protein